MDDPGILWVLTLPLGFFMIVVLGGSPPPVSGLRLVAAGAVLAYGLFGTVVAARQQWSLGRYEPVTARVIESERGARRYDWTFAYEYEWQGERRVGSRVTYAPRLRSRGDTDRLAERYPTGAEIEVHVDPERPSRSVVLAAPHYGLAIAGAIVHGSLALALGVTIGRRPRGAARENRSSHPS